MKSIVVVALLICSASLTSCAHELHIRDKETLQRVEEELMRRRLAAQPLVMMALDATPFLGNTFLLDKKLEKFSTEELVEALIREDTTRVYEPDSRRLVPKSFQSRTAGPPPTIGTVAVTSALSRNFSAVALVVNDLKVPLASDGVSRDLATKKYLDKKSLCSGQTFADKLVADDTVCTAFLVGRDVMITAGHCIDDTNRTEKKFVFGFRGDTPQTHFTADDIYSAASVTSVIGTPDYAIVKLDRTVCNRDPVEMESTHSLAKGDRVYVIGHPAGLPLTFANDSKVRSAGDDLFVANLDVLGGNSGSPVFLESSDKVVGIVVDGDDGYLDIGTCTILRECPITKKPIPFCEGEGCTPIKAVAPFQSATCP